MAPQVAQAPEVSQTIEVRHRSDVAPARNLAREAAIALGFSSEESEEIALVASELATNLVKYTPGGRLVLTPVLGPEKRGLQIESRDEGPGIADIRQALADGYSSSGSLGVGLGSVNRLTDEFDIKSHPGRGTHLTCRKWIRARPGPARDCPLDFGVASRGKTDPNGDDFLVKRWDGSALAGLIDGCGHGQQAHQAARITRHYAETHYDLPIEALFAGIERACHGTRGVVMALARFDWEAGKLTFGSVGNIEARLLNGETRLPFIVRRGILGAHAPRPVVSTIPWDNGNILVLHTDGLTSHWSAAQFKALLGKPADEIARELLRSLGKTLDDATALVVCPKNP